MIKEESTKQRGDAKSDVGAFSTFSADSGPLISFVRSSPRQVISLVPSCQTLGELPEGLRSSWKVKNELVFVVQQLKVEPNT
jgi:hypothetical protein